MISMHKNWGRRFAAATLALAIGFGATMASPSAAEAKILTASGGSLGIYFSPADMTGSNYLNELDIAVGQELTGTLSINDKGDYSRHSTYRVESSDCDIATVSKDKYGSWILKIAPNKVGTARITAIDEADSGNQGYIEISSVKSLNRIKSIGLLSGDYESPVTDLDLYYTDNCPKKCGETHFGKRDASLIIEFENESRPGTVFTLKDLSGANSVASLRTISNIHIQSGYSMGASCQVVGLSKGKGKLRAEADYGMGKSGTFDICNVAEKNQDPVFEERCQENPKMLVGGVGYLSNILWVSPNETVTACVKAHWGSGVTDGSGITDVTYSLEPTPNAKEENGQLTALKPGFATVVAVDGLGVTHKKTFEIEDPNSIDISNAKFSKQERDLPIDLEKDDTYFGGLWIEEENDMFSSSGRVGILSRGAAALEESYVQNKWVDSGRVPNEFYTYKSSDPSVLEVCGVKYNGDSSFGHLVPRSYGTVTVSMYLAGRLCDTMTVHVVPRVQTSVSIKSGYKTNMAPGDTQKLAAEVMPEDKAGSVIWSSSDESVLKVDSKGNVIAVADGTATITAAVDGVSACTDAITVETPVVETTGVLLNSEKLDLKVGGAASKLTATVEPANATNQNVEWTSSNDGVVTVDQEGNVTPVAAGSATVTVKTVDGGFTAACKVTVIQPVTGISLDLHDAKIVGAGTQQLVATVTPVDASQAVVWKSDDESVAKVDQSGLVTAVSKGKANVVVTTADGSLSDTCKVEVSNPVMGITVDSASINLKKGEKVQIKATLEAGLPGAVDDDSIVLKDTDSKVFKVSGEGGSYTVEALKSGNGSFKIVAGENGTVGQLVTVSVTNPAQKIELDNIALNFTVGDVAKKLSAVVSPSDADNADIVWTSSNEAIAKVENGTVIPVSAGTATITAQCGNLTAACTVTVAAKQIAVSTNGKVEASVADENGVVSGKVDGETRLVVEEPSNLTEAAKTQIEGMKSDTVKVLETLDIHFEKSDGSVVEIANGDGASMVVRIKMTESMKKLTNLKVLHVSDEGAVEAVDTWVEGDYLCFRTTHFSTYVVTGQELSKQPSAPSDPSRPGQPTTVTTTKTNVSVKKSTKGTLADTGDRTFAVVAAIAVFGATLIAIALKLLSRKND